jgi:hypothetical protein
MTHGDNKKSPAKRLGFHLAPAVGIEPTTN